MAETILSKVCSFCSQKYPLSDFRSYTSRVTGEKSYRPKCRNCSRIECAKWKGDASGVIAKIERENYLLSHPDQKFCVKGNHFLPKTDFNKLATRPDGLSPTCRTCQKRFREENKDKILLSKKRYAEENREKVLLASKQNWAKHKAGRNAARRLRRITEPEYFREMASRHYAKHADRMKLNAKFQGIKRRARKAQAQGFYTASEWQAKKLYFGNRCYLCGEAAEVLEQDHRIPISRGGSNWLANIAPCCVTCNRKKHNKTEREFRESRMKAKDDGLLQHVIL